MYRLNQCIPDIRSVHSYSGLTVGKQDYCIQHILLPCYLFLLFAGALFFIPAIFVNRFTTAPELWVRAGVCSGIAGYVLLTKKRIPFPSKGYILLISAWAAYLVWKNRGNLENETTVITLAAAFFLFYAIGVRLKDKRSLFVVFTFLAVAVSLWGLGQFAGLLPSGNGSFSVTGPFDNPAGISAVLVLLLPFTLYGFRYRKKKFRSFSFVSTALVIAVIVLSQARTAILATAVILILFFIRLLKIRNVRLSFVHYAVIALCGLLLFAGLIFIKKDSADGRLLIWRCSAQLIFRKPVSGYGGNGFTANYMNEQSAYFTRDPDSKYAMLADNVRHPFNEFVKWTVNYGLTGLCLILLLIVIPLQASWKNNSPELFFIRLSLIATGISALFSYPFNYPFVRLMAVALLAFMSVAGSEKGITLRNGYLLKTTAILFASGLLSASARQTFYEHQWHIVAHKSLRGETVRMLPRYESLYTHLHYNDLFLYNYAAELNVAGQYAESIRIAGECGRLWADYDLHMLMADNRLQLQQHDETENQLKQAAAMCPVKFMPLYKLAELYVETGRKEEARGLAKKIMNKKVKIASPVINGIKNKMRKLLNETDSLNDLSQVNK